MLSNPALATSLVVGVAIVLSVVAIFRYRQSTASRIDNFMSLIDHLAEPSMLIQDQKIASVNQPMEDLIYKSREDLLGRNPYEIWDALEFNLAPRQEIVEHLRREDYWSFISKLIRHDGSVGHAEIRVSLLDEDQELLIVFVTDITDRVESERRLRESEMQLSTSQAIAGLGYWHYRVDKASIDWSEELLRTFGLDQPEAREKYPTDESRWALIHPGDVSILQTRIQSAIDTGITPPETSFRIRRPDDELRHARIRFGIIADNAGHVEELFGVVQDITDFVRAEERLRHAQRMEAVGSLTGGISHDFNNLLQVIIGNAELLEGNVSPAGEESLQTIRHAAQRGSELTQLLLAYSRRQHLEPRTINVNDYVSGMLPLLRRTLGEAITIDSDPESDLRNCRVDPGQLENCILNLAINAQHAMPDGGTLTITTRNVHLDDDYASRHEEVVAGDYVQLTITDTGSGMNDAVRVRAFEPFFTTKEVGKGTGLGLSMVYGFIKQSAGHVELKSEENAGTSISLFLPVAGTDDAVETGTSTDHELMPFTGTVLLVEDDPQVARLTGKFLASLGLDVITANSLQAVRKKLSEKPLIDLLLTDVVLPGPANGPEIVREVKDRYPEIRVLFMSGYTDNAIAHQHEVPLLTKPFTRADLVGKLYQVLGD